MSENHLESRFADCSRKPKTVSQKTVKTFSERDSGIGVFLWICEISKKIFFTEHLRATASAFRFSKAATGGVIWKKRSWKFCKIHRKTPLVCEIFKNTFFTEHLRKIASAFRFSEVATGGVLWKKVFLKILRNFQKHLSYRTPPENCLCL